MHPVTIVLLVILNNPHRITGWFYISFAKTVKKQEEQQAQIRPSKQTVSMLVIDKKKCHLRNQVSTDGHRPDTKLLRRSKMPIVNLKLDRRFHSYRRRYSTLSCEKEIKAGEGLYIVGKRHPR